MPTNDVVLPDESVPEIAAVLIDRGAYRFVLRDASEGALQIDGERPETDEIALKDGSVLQLGSYRLRLNTRFTDSIERIGSTNVLSGRANEAVDAFVRGQGERKPLNKDRPFNIGSADDNDLKIEDDFVSGYHCRISNRGGRWILSDLESTNGTIVNGMRVSEAELPMPATITVGRATLLFEAAHEAHASPHRNVFHGMIGTTSLMQTVFRDIERMAPAKEPILIFGESGCG
ncbi:MAG: FHA domain-containing protein, partial [Myxococcota bacterium]